MAEPFNVIAAGVPPAPSVLVGREESLRDIKQLLGIQSDGRRLGPVSVLGIVCGWPGVGKTSIVAALAHDPEVAKAFPEGVVWASLGQTPDLFSLLARWERAFGKDDVLRTMTVAEITTVLAALFRNRRILLIVDDAWEAAHVDPFRQMLGPGCALLVTTRQIGVASDLAHGSDVVYNLPVLSEKDSLELLSTLAPSVVSSHPQECQELVKDLECLPLALRVAGRLLNTEATMGWGVAAILKEIRDGTKLLSSKASVEQSELERLIPPNVAVFLQKAIDRLDTLTRTCFAYLGAFAPKPATFDMSAMAAVWDVADPKPIVDVLCERGLLEQVGDDRFQMHPMLVEHARSLLS